MKYIIFIILIMGGMIFNATKLDAANDSRFDWTLGQPSTMENTTATCTDTATTRYSWVLGQPAPTFDATANCTLSGGATPRSPIKINSGTIKINSGTIKK